MGNKKKLKREKRLIKYLKFYKLMCDVSEPPRLYGSLIILGIFQRIYVRILLEF